MLIISFIIKSTVTDTTIELYTTSVMVSVFMRSIVDAASRYLLENATDVVCSFDPSTIPLEFIIINSLQQFVKYLQFYDMYIYTRTSIRDLNRHVSRHVNNTRQYLFQY